MSSLTLEYLGYIAPEYTSVDTERFNALKDIAADFVNDNVFGGKTRYAQALYIAHILKIGERQGASGTVISEKVGDVSKNYSDPNKSMSLGSDGLGDTSYGRQYLAVRKSVVRTPII